MFKLVKLLLVVVLVFSISGVSVIASYPQGNIYGQSVIPKEAYLEDVSKPDHIIGTGTPESCTSEAFVEAVSKGGTIVFNGGNQPFTIVLKETAKIFNNEDPDVIIDGGGLVTLSGGNQHRILYMNTADPDQVWTTSHAQNQDHPRLTLQNITFENGNSSGEEKYTGGGALWLRGGRFKVINCKFINNRCDDIGPDIGGGAIRVFDQYNDLPVYIINSTFGGQEGYGNVASNGGAISSIGVSWHIVNSVFTYNKAIGNGGNPKRSGTPGGGSGGAIYNDGNEMQLTIEGSIISHNEVTTHGSGIFFVSNNHTGDIVIKNSTVKDNIGGTWYLVREDISSHSDTVITETNSGLTEMENGIAMTTKSTVLVDGLDIGLTAYNIRDNNYFKLRDLAMILNGSQKQFEVVWDRAEKAIKVTTDHSYTVVGGELNNSRIMTPLMYRLDRPVIIINGENIALKAYNIRDNNYFKLRDIGALFDFGVIWNNIDKQIEVSTNDSYVE